ncbi:hypothetical protein [Streptomyces sp. 3212.3]|nr:hypothetical protein [Streptomyces sp. 3212.3]
MGEVWEATPLGTHFSLKGTYGRYARETQVTAAVGFTPAARRIIL